LYFGGTKILLVGFLETKSMKLKLFYIFFLGYIAVMASVESLAQDSGMMDVEVIEPERDRSEKEKILLSPGEGDVRYIPRSYVTTVPVTPKDSSAVSHHTISTHTQQKFKSEKPAPTPKNPVEKQSKREDSEDSILSFNFLYYIIQKYKLQDIR
jgi:hypothetical protein